RSISESPVWTWAVFNFHVWCSHSHCLQRIRTLLVSAPCPQGRISALGVAAEGRKLWERTMICQICAKVAVMSSQVWEFLARRTPGLNRTSLGARSRCLGKVSCLYLTSSPLGCPKARGWDQIGTVT